MKNLSFTFLAAGSLFYGLSGCSSSTTESSTTSTAEEVTETNTKAMSQQEAVKFATPPAGKNGAGREDTVSFQARAASTDIFEIQTSMQAKAKAQNAEVKSFADQLVTDHTQTTTELQQIAAQRNLPISNTALVQHQQMIDNLTNEKDMNDFDKKYIDMQITVHQQAIDLFESAAKNQSDPELKAYAARHLPHLKMHLETAKSLKGQLK